MVLYMDDFRDRHDAKRLATMRLLEDAWPVRPVLLGLERDTAVGAWKRNVCGIGAAATRHNWGAISQIPILCMIFVMEGGRGAR